MTGQIDSWHTFLRTRERPSPIGVYFVSMPITPLLPTTSLSIHIFKMAARQRQGAFRSALFFISFLSFFFQSNALYFYLDGTTPKCFYEELPKDTLVVGKHQAMRTWRSFRY